MLRETLFIFLGIIGSIKLLYELQNIPFIEKYLPTLTALLLIYPPVLHATLRKLSISFFETKFSQILSSLRLLLITSLVIFPPFLLGNHFYQKLIFGLSFEWRTVETPMTLILIQLFLVAFPEELFFRGYLQTIIRRHLTINWAIPLTSLLFAVSHSLIALQWWHFAIFFPSLIFGWLREKTDGLVAPILFHAFCNILVQWIAVCY